VNLNHSATIRELVRKSIEIFSAKGYAATNLVEITDALGISRGPIYYHFKDKLGLYNAAFDQFDHDVRETHAKIVQSNKPFVEFVEDVIFDCVIRNTLHGPNFFFGIESLPELESIRLKFDALNTDIFQEKIDYVKLSIKRGEIDPNTDPVQVADLIYIVFYGVITSIQKGLIQEISEPSVRELIRVLIGGIETYCKLRDESNGLSNKSED